MLFLRNLTLCGGNQVFFLISGMMFYLAYYKRLSNDKMSISDFLKNRIKRMYPLTIFTTTLIFLIGVLRFHTLHIENSFNIKALIIDFLFLGNTLLGDGSANIFGNYNGPIWYISLLLLCYIVCALCMLLVKKKKTVLWFLIPFYLGAWMLWSRVQIPLPLLSNSQIGIGLYNFFLGFFFMIFLEKFKTTSKSFQIPIRILSLVIALKMMRLFVITDYSFGFFGGSDDAFNIPIWMPLFTALYATPINIIFDNKFFRYLGQLSFHIYLYHMVVFHIRDYILEYNIIKYSKIISISPNHQMFIMFVPTIIISMISLFLLPRLTNFISKQYQKQKKK